MAEGKRKSVAPHEAQSTALAYAPVNFAPDESYTTTRLLTMTFREAGRLADAK